MFEVVNVTLDKVVVRTDDYGSAKEWYLFLSQTNLHHKFEVFRSRSIRSVK